jgi:Cdc6-like AAA superfamily ATPase
MLLDQLRECNKPTLAIVDEASFLSDPSILATLDGITGLTVFAVAIDEHGWFTSLKQDIGRRFRPSTTVQLDPYGPDKLRAIVAERARIGLESGVIDDSAIETIAVRAEGNARFAIALLRRGAREVMNDAVEQVTPDVIEAVEEDARDAIRDRQRQQLGTYQRLLYDLVQEAGEIRAERLHERFAEAVDDDSPPSKRTRNRYLYSLRRYGMIELEGQGRAAHYLIV